MKCSISYIDNAPISEAEKNRLEEIHLSVFQQAKESQAFREIENRLQAIKAKYADATAFVGKINGQFGPVSRLNSIGSGNAVLTVNVLPLAKEQQGMLFQLEGNSVASPETLKKVRQVLDKIGVQVHVLFENAVKSRLGITSINAMTDVASKVIAISEGKEGVALTEEMVHIATSILEQTNPQLVTEMISKIDRFSIYKRTLDAYKGIKTYQLENGKPDIRKIKKEAVDKLIAEVIINENANVDQNPELRSEENLSIVERMWNAILDWFKGAYRKSNINIFQEAATSILEGELDSNVVLPEGEFYQITENKPVDDIYKKIIDMDSRMALIPQLGDKKRHYTFDEVEVAKSVTEKVKEGQNMPERTPEQKKEDDQKRQWGSEGHEYIANYIQNNLIDENGYKLPFPKNEAISTPLNSEVTKSLKAFATELINSYKPGTRFIIEKKVINEKAKGKIASTMDFVAIEPEGAGFKMDIYDWKFMNINTEKQEDVPWYKKKEWNSQMGEYATIMYNYGVKPQELRKARMIPFQANYAYKAEKGKLFGKSKDLALTSIEIGKLDVKNETNMYLLPVPLDSETTGDVQIDSLTRSLREYHKKMYSIIASPEEQHIKNQKLNEISTAIRALHVQKDFAPLANVGTAFLKNTAEAFKKFENIDYDKLSVEEINNKLGELLDIQESAGKFASLDEAFLSSFPKESLSPEEKQVLKSLENISAHTRRMLVRVNELFENYTVYKALKENVTNKAENVLAPELEIGNFAKTFLEGSKLAAKLIKLASNLIQRAKKEIDIFVNKKVDEFTPILVNLEKEAKAKGKSAFDLIGTVNNGKLELISKIDKDFKKQVFEARKEKDKKFFTSNMDMDKYNTLSKKAIDRRIEEEKKKVFSSDPEENEEKRIFSIEKIKNNLNINSKAFNGYEDYDFKRLFWESLKEEPHYSKEFKDMSEDAKKAWQFFTDLNTKAKKLGYLAPRQGLAFFPLMEATMLEKLSKTDNILSESGDILKDLYTVRVEEEYQYSKIDEETGELKKEIPKLFTRTNKDVKQLSTDLNKVSVLWIKALAEYESSRNIENTLLVLHNVEKNKGHIITDASGKIAWDGGLPRTAATNEKNASILQTIIDDGIYGLKENLSSIGNVGLSTVVDKAKEGATEEEREKTKLSTKKTLENSNKLVQSLAVGLKLLVAIPNYFGFNMQAAINAGRLITFGQFEKNNAKITTGVGLTTIEKALLDRVTPLNENITQEARRKMAKKQGLLDYLNTWSFYDVMMSTNSFPDRLLQFANALSFLENTMVLNGELVNIRQFVAKEDREKKKDLSFEDRRALEKTYEDRVQKLKDEKSLPKIATIGENGLEIPGVSDQEIAKFSVKIIEYGRNMSGQMNQNNKADYRRDTILKSFMMFKGWIPKQFSLRTLDINKNLELDEWEYGRTRAFIKTIQKLGFKNIANLRDIMLGTDTGLQILKEMYDAKKQAYYEKTGQELEITEQEFYDLMRNEIRNQMKELALLVSLVGLVVAVKMAEPPEDEDAGTMNRWKFWAKAANKAADELFFYYNPLSFESMTRGSILPALGLLTKTQKFLWALGQEGYGEYTGDEEMIEKAHPSKYFFNLVPVAYQLQTEVMPLIDAEWAKEQGIKTTEEARQKQ